MKTLAIIVIILAFVASADFRETLEGTVRGLLYARLQLVNEEDADAIEPVMSCFSWSSVCARESAECDWASMSKADRDEFIGHTLGTLWQFYDSKTSFWPNTREFKVVVDERDGANTATVTWDGGVMTFGLERFSDGEDGFVWLIVEVAWG